MFDDKFNIRVDEYEQNILIKALYEMRTRLKEEEKHTDAVDDLLIKVAGGKERKTMVAEKDCYEER